MKYKYLTLLATIAGLLVASSTASAATVYHAEQGMHTNGFMVDAAVGRNGNGSYETRAYVVFSVLKPWYANSSSGRKIGINDGSVIDNVFFSVGDTPRQSLCDQWNETYYNGSEIETDQIDRSTFRLDFDLYFAVRTKDSSNGASSVYTQRAKASWSLAANGDFSGNRIWSGSGARVEIDSLFAPVINGDVVPNSSGDIANGLNFNWTDQTQ